MINTSTKYPLIEMKFQEQYGLSKENLNTLYDSLMTGTFSGFYKDNPQNYIISIRAYPFNVSDIYNNAVLSTFTFGGVTSSFICSRLKNKKGAIKIGQFSYIPYFANFLDYSPYTKISCYLPYIGFINLPTEEIINKTISFWYAIDTFNGVVTAYVWNDTNDYLILTTTGKMGIDINLGGSNAYDRMRNNFFTGVGVVGGSFSGYKSNGGMLGITQTGINTGIEVMNNRVERIEKGDIGEGVNTLVGSQKVTIIIDRPNVSSEEYKPFRGKPLMQTRVLNTLTGYTEVEDIHIENISIATKQELEEIENLLKSGVIL